MAIKTLLQLARDDVTELTYALTIFSRIECQNCDFKLGRHQDPTTVAAAIDVAKIHARQRKHTIKVIDETIHTYRSAHG